MAVPEVEVLLPVHNEALGLEKVLREIYREISPTVSLGFIVCEDGSRDNTREVLRSLAADLPIRLNLSEQRKGYSRALREGMDMLQAPYLLCLDSDGQCDPRDFPRLWDARHQADVIIGWRTRRADPLARRLFSRIFYCVYQAVLRVPVHDPSCPFVLMPQGLARRIGPELGAMQQGFWWEFVARVHRRGYRVREIPVSHRPRFAGVTQVYRWKRMPGIFFRHLAAIFRIRAETRRGGS